MLAEASRSTGPGVAITGVTASFGIAIVSTSAEIPVAAHAAIVAMSFDAVLRAAGARRIGLVTPFTSAYASKIPPHVAAADAEIVAMVETVAATRPDAVLTSRRPQPRPRAAFQASYSGRAASESG